MTLIIQKAKFIVKSAILRLFYFQTEKQLLAGTFHSNDQRPSWIFMTLHKSGSSFLAERFDALFRRNGYTAADLSSYFAKTNPAARIRFNNSDEAKRQVFSAKGVFYNAIRIPFIIPSDVNINIILVLRDPRDVLVSYYFSCKHSHPVQNPDFLNERTDAQNMSIDEFVLSRSKIFAHRYELLLPLIGRSNVLFFKYEDMIADPLKVEKSIAEATHFDITAGSFMAKSDFTVTREDVNRHKRKVQPGDHIQKLKPATITQLDIVFASVLKQLYS